MADEVTRKVFSLYEEGGQQAYLGEAVTQLEHAVQCAMLAEASGQPTQVILGALLHDIGHLIKSQGQGQMVTDGLVLGVDRHDKLGADFLEGLGVPSTICSISRWHVDAKRYLCHTDPQYYNSLSEASRLTLVHQGGAMTTAEAAQFEQDPDCQSILQARRWDEASKVANMQCQPLSRYRAMFHKHMDEILQAR